MRRVSASYAVFAFSSVTSATYVSWFGFRGAQINATVALEGGTLQTGNFSGSTVQNAKIVSSGGGGVYRTLDLTQPFAAGANAENLLTAKSELVDVNAPSFSYGVMFHNDRSWWTYAGIPSNTKPSVISDSVIRDTLYGPMSSPNGLSNSNGLNQTDGTNGVFQNVSAAAYASSGDPQQKLGWLFGGMDLVNNNSWRYPLVNTTGLQAVDAFYQADMATSDYTMRLTAAQSPAASQINGYLPRAQGGLVWLPFGSQGVLLALGGVQYPADLYAAKSPVQTVNNTYMSDLLIYDIAGSKWYSQSTLENGPKPSQLAAFCTAVVPTQNGLSQEIIVYGGYDGTNSGNTPPSDDVWILSIPAFQWTQVISSKNNTLHGRKSQFCFAPNPSTFVTVGGSGLNGGALGSDTFIDVLNLTSLTWGSSYDPASVQNFSVPSSVQSQLNWPAATGPASRTVGNVNNAALSSLFSTAYPTAIKASYPYASPSTTTSSSPAASSSAPGNPVHHKTNVPLIASLATVIPVLVIAAIIAVCCIRRRKAGHQRTKNNRSTVSSWLGRSSTIDPHPEKSNASTEETAINSPSDYFTTPVMGYNRKFNDIHEADPQHTYTPPVRSPGLTSTAVGSPGERYEIMDHPPRGSMSISNHPYHPHPITGEQSDIRSEMTSEDRQAASELPHDRSKENLSVPSSGAVAGATQPSSVSRKPVAERRVSTPLPSPTTPDMGHARGTSDVSSAVLTASPNTDFRRSQHIDGLPEKPTLGEGRATPTTHGRASAYKEKFDDQ